MAYNRGEMQPPPTTIIAKLKNLQGEIELLKGSSPKSVEFKNWRTEVIRWLNAGKPYTRSEKLAFLNLHFMSGGTWASSSIPSGQLWVDGLGQADHLLNDAIENLENGWSHEEEEAPKPPPGPPAQFAIYNTNLQVNVSVQAVLEAIAQEVAKVDPAEGKSLRERMKRWAENPILEKLLELGVNIFMKRYGG
jgi:hypothetical protein